MNDRKDMLLRYSEHTKHLNDLAKVTLKVLLSGKDSSKAMVTNIVKIIVQSDKNFLLHVATRKHDVVLMKKLYLFIKYLYFNERVQDVADECNMSRSNVYHHCQCILDEYDTSVEFRSQINLFFDDLTVSTMKSKLDKVRRV